MERSEMRLADLGNLIELRSIRLRAHIMRNVI
jgi:hypothetical protein